MKEELLARLKGNSTLDDLDNLQFVGCGNFAINKIISGDYKKGIPIGGISQFKGQSSVGKTLFAVSIARTAINQDFIVKLLDAENAFSKSFAQVIGIDTKKLLYSCPETVEDSFEDIEQTIRNVRELDKDTPLIIILDSLACLPIKSELTPYEERKKGETGYEQNNMEGAIRAKIVGSCLRKINPLLRKNNVALIIINQQRSKVALYAGGLSDASGGMALEYYLMCDILVRANKNKDLIKDDEENPLGIEVELEVRKNKCAIPFQKTRAKIDFKTGLDQYSGLLDSFIQHKVGIIESGKGRYQYKDTSFTEKTLPEMIQNKSNKDFDSIRQLLGVN